MADYKSIISGTIANLANKVKEVAENANVREIYDNAASKAKGYARIAKLSLELNTENDVLNALYAEIGKLYFEQTKDAPQGDFAPLFAEAEAVYAHVSDIEAELAALKASDACPAGEECVSDIDVEIEQFEDVVEAAEQEACPVEEEPAPVEEIVPEEDKPQE